MAGKTRPSLREKTLRNIALSNLSLTDKKCIEEVFKKFEELTQTDIVEVVRCKKCANFQELIKDKVGVCYHRNNRALREATDFCSYGVRADGGS